MKAKFKFTEPHILITNPGGRVSVRSSFPVDATLQILGIARDTVLSDALRHRWDAELQSASSGIVSLAGRPLVSSEAIGGNGGGGASEVEGN